jgi:N-acetylmuramoyl-L-alanine amidase
MARHVVKQGECFASIAARYGFADAKTIYEDTQNAELRQRRPYSGVLCPGDEVFIPERKSKEASIRTGEVGRFVVQAPMRSVQLTLLDGEDKPIADAPFVVEGDGVTEVGETDGAGGLTVAVPATLRRAVLAAGGFRWELELGALDPLEGTPDGGRSGVRGRLTNLGYDPGAGSPESEDRLRASLHAFEADHGVERSPDDDSPTMQKLKEIHGC